MCKCRLKWLFGSLCLVVQLAVLVGGQTCLKEPSCPPDFNLCNYQGISLSLDNQMFVTDTAVDIPIILNCTTNCGERPQCLEVSYNARGDDETKPCSEVLGTSCAIISLTKESWFHLDNLCPNFNYYINFFHGAPKDPCPNLDFEIQTKPKKQIGCYRFDRPGKPMFPGGVTITSNSMTFSTEGGVLCTKSSEPNREITLQIKNTMPDCLIDYSFALNESCTYVVENLCPNSKYEFHYRENSAFVAGFASSFCTLPSAPSEPENFKIERVFNSATFYSYEVTWTKPKEFLADLDLYYNLKWRKNDGQAANLTQVFNLTAEKYVIDRSELDSKSEYIFEIEAFYQEPQHDDKIIGAARTLKAIIEMESDEVKLKKAESHGDEINVVLTWPKANSELTFIKHQMQLHLVDMQACRLQELEGYIEPIQQLIDVDNMELREANWVVEREKCFVISLVTVYKEGRSLSLSNFLDTVTAVPEKSNLGIILGAVFGSLAFLGLVGAIFLLWRNQKWIFGKKQRSAREDNIQTANVPRVSTEPVNSQTTNNENIELRVRNSRVIRTQRFIDEIEPRINDNHENSLKREFKDLTKISKIHDIKTPNSKCRVPALAEQNPQVHDILGSAGVKGEYMVSQCPAVKDYKPEHFWRMIVDEKVNVVVMLTVNVKQGETLCPEYWEDHEKKYGEINVKFETESPENQNSRNGFVKRKFTLKKDHLIHNVTHYQFKEWHRNDCPEHEKLLYFLSNLWNERDNRSESNNIILFVHCSPDFGRTATFIILDKILNDIRNKKSELDVFGYAFTIRKKFKNLGLVQDAREYIFIHECIIKYLRDPGRYETANASLMGNVNQGFATDENDYVQFIDDPRAGLRSPGNSTDGENAIYEDATSFRNSTIGLQRPLPLTPNTDNNNEADDIYEEV